MSKKAVTGAHYILSFLLGVMVFNIVPTTKNATTNQIIDLESSKY
jgi:hypothetical protein